MIKYLLLAVLAITGSVEASDLTKKQTADWIVKKFNEGKITPILIERVLRDSADNRFSSIEFSSVDSCTMNVKFGTVIFRTWEPDNGIPYDTGSHAVDSATISINLGGMKYPEFSTWPFETHFKRHWGCDTENIGSDCITSSFTGYEQGRNAKKIRNLRRKDSTATIAGRRLALNFKYEPLNYKYKFQRALTHLITLCRPAVEDEPF